MALLDLRGFIAKAEAAGEVKRIHGADRNLEIGAICELALQNSGPMLLFDQIPGYDPNYAVAANVCTGPRRGRIVIGMDPDLPEQEMMERFKKRWDAYQPVAPQVVKSGPIMENVKTGDDIDLLQFPVPIWHEKDGGAYIGTGLSVITKDPDTGAINVGCYRVMLHDRNTTGLFAEPESDGRGMIEKYWARGQAAPIAISFGPEPLLFLSSCSRNGVPRGTQEYEYTGYIAGEPVQVILGQHTGLPISAFSEIAIEGEVPPPDKESRIEGPFGEWTGYYELSSTMEPVIHVKTLYHRTNPILFGASPLQHKNSYSFDLPVTTIGSLGRLQKLGLPVREVVSLVPFGCTVVTIAQEKPDDVTRLMDALETMYNPSRLTIIVDDDVNPKDPYDVLWALGSRFDPEEARTSISESKWLLNPLRTMEDRSNREGRPYKRMIMNGCRPFHRLMDFPPVNRFSQMRRDETWEKWDMSQWLSGHP